MRGGLNTTKAIPAPDAIRRWPAPPDGFTPGEADAWADIGRSLVELGTASRADLLLVRIAARTLARLDAAFADPGDVKVSTVNALARLAADLLNRLGLSPQARATVGALPRKAKKGTDPLAEFE